jgi:osmotically-inducible protein OsmY
MIVGISILALIGCLGACNKSPTYLPAPSTNAAATHDMSDMDVTTNVKTALLRDENLKHLDISVVTLKGDVRIIGLADNQGQIDDAIKVTRESPGVHAVHDELSVKK